MKSLFILAFIVACFFGNASAQKAVKAKNAYKYIGKEVTVKGKFWVKANSSYFQFCEFVIGPDSAHVVLTVIIKGEVYIKGAFGTMNNRDKTMQITGIIQKDSTGHIYMAATR